ncbi:MAG: hypothetical protein U9N82_03460, partial [Thermodesulfobacteriota bacterium]|nr:hypothetical protein [Thermodesulfobacteriota bacterium]
NTQTAEIPQPDIEQPDIDIESINIVDYIDNLTVLAEMGTQVCEGCDIDEESRAGWKKAQEKTLELLQNLTDKTWAGETVSNVKYPALMTACVQFAARAYPNIIKGTDIVKAKIVGEEIEVPPEFEGQVITKQQRGENVAKHMSWQLTEQMGTWEEDTDQLLVSLPALGCMFRKTYYDTAERHNVSELVFPSDLVINYNASTIEDTPRITQIIELTPNQIEERVRAGIFRKVEFGEPIAEDTGYDQDTPHTFLEQHRWWDLDEDGYQEPYVITVHRDTQQVVRITARYGPEDVEFDQKGDILKINPTHYYTKYQFMPAFDGSFYGVGFGYLISDINSTVNTTINQMLDAGSLSNRQAGFLSTGIQLGRNSSMKFKQGEWKKVEVTGGDLRKGIVPLPVNPPSPVLFELLSLMIDATKEVTSTANILTGEQPAANVPATTTLAMIEQGLKVFSSIYLRIKRSLTSEFAKLRRLNEMYLPMEYEEVLDTPQATAADYLSGDYDIVPVSDEADLTDVQRMLKAQSLLELSGRGLNDIEILKRYLEALQVPDIEELIPDEPPPDPQLEMEARKIEQKDQELSLEERKVQITEAESVEKMIKVRAEAVRALADAEAKEAGPQMEQYTQQIDELKYAIDVQAKVLDNISQKNSAPEGAAYSQTGI